MQRTVPVARRAFFQWLGASALCAPAVVSSAPASGRGHVRIADAAISLQFDEWMRCRVVHLAGPRPVALTDFDASETLTLANGAVVDRFVLRQTQVDALPDDAHGPARRLRLEGRSTQGLIKTVAVTLHDAFPGFAWLEVNYRNESVAALAIKGWGNAQHRVLPRAGRAQAFWSFAGASHEDRHDWVQPVKPGFAQDNFMGMNAPDYGGGTPVVDVWRRDAGLAVGHLEEVPQQVSLPTRWLRGGVQLGLSAKRATTLAPGQTLTTALSFVAVHQGDYFAALDAYRRVMAQRGIVAATPPAAAYEPIWCAWGYEREFTVERVEATLPKVKELGLDWAVIDDGWQAAIGDWRPNTDKFPGGEAQLKALATSIRNAGLKPRLWIAPLAVAPGSDELHEHSDMLLRDKDGAVQNVSWWNSFYLCPAYGKTIERAQGLVRKVIGEWGFEGLKIDGQHLNGVALCHNPAHKHARPEESAERLSGFFHAIYDTARAINPNAVIELCPCGTSFAFHNLPWMNQTPASDPLSSWQVRHKGKTLKALMGPRAAYAGDHVELSDGGADFASTVGVGGVVSTKFTWPEDPKPKDSFLLTPEHETLWRRWITLYREQMLPTGVYRGELYDIGFDKPEAHVVEKDGRLHYAFYAPQWDGVVELRGLKAARYELRNLFDGQALGTVTAAKPHVRLAFKNHLLLCATPLDTQIT